MKKTKQYDIISWEFNPTEPLDIDWPAVHRKLGKDHLDWLLDKPHHKCQLMVNQNRNKLTLAVEFYDSQLATEYHLRWG